MRKPEKCMEGRKADRILLIEKPGEPTREAAWDGFCGDGGTSSRGSEARH